ncbi:MAG TPA: polymer-forming cytoskeletal protein, partial [Longimicrobiales bacterium]|nr:polymer-forming cytoskeletal protein [Longimicrobiales bacterium]
MKRILATTLLLLSVPCAGHAQQRAVREAGLPGPVERRLLMLLEAPDTRVRSGPGRLEAAERVPGALFVEGGTYAVAGRVEGDLVMLGGELVIEPGARVDGEVVVVNGSLSGEVDRLTALSVYRREGAGAHAEGHARPDGRWRHGDEVDVEVRPSCREPRCRRGHDDRDDHGWEHWDHPVTGDLDLSLRVEESYNRVEGLPLLFGPVIHTAGRYPLRIEALGIWRSVHGDLDTGDMGYLVRAEQRLLRGRVRFGAGARSTIDAIEGWQLSDLESSLATLLFHSDRRDWYERTGWSAHATVAPRSLPLSATLEYRDEEHASVPVRDPWALGGGGWRAQPLVAEGALRSLVGSVEIDTRDSRRDPYT